MYMGSPAASMADDAHACRELKLSSPRPWKSTLCRRCHMEAASASSRRWWVLCVWVIPDCGPFRIGRPRAIGA